VKFCISFGGLRADQAITETVLEAVQPLGVEAALRAYDAGCRDQDQKSQALALALEKARYEADRARRQYDAVEPENRLVAVELEARWNLALKQVAAAEERLETSRSAAIAFSEAERARLLRLGSDLRTVWEHEAAPVTLKKRILRTLIEEIIADVDEQANELIFRIHWAGGVHTVMRVHKNRPGHHGRVTDREVVDLVRELAAVASDAAIASLLNRLGYETGAGNGWNQTRVCTLRGYHDIACFDAAAPRKWITLAEAAERLEVGVSVIRTLINRGTLSAKQVVRSAPWMIQPTELQRPEVQSYVTAVRQGRRVPRRDARQIAMPLL
jgi:hypothetical protein